MRRWRKGGQGPSRPVLISLWCVGVVLLNFPMLIVFDKEATVFGLPLLPLALFSIWAVLIGALALAMERGQPGQSGAGQSDQSRPVARSDPDGS